MAERLNNSTLTRVKGSKPQAAGIFAPPLDLDRLELYREKLEEAPDDIKEAGLELCDMVEEYLDQPVQVKSTDGEQHPSGQIGARIVRLGDTVAKKMNAVVPSQFKLKVMRETFDAMPTGAGAELTEKSDEFSDGEVRHKSKYVVTNQTDKDLRDLCHHLLWFAIELSLGRVPITNDMLEENYRVSADSLDETSHITVRPLGSKSSAKKAAKPQAKAKK